MPSNKFLLKTLTFSTESCAIGWIYEGEVYLHEPTTYREKSDEKESVEVEETF